jgi:putative protease
MLQVSPELSGSEIAVLAREVHRQGDGPELAVFVQGNLETMVTDDCLRAVSTKCRRTSGPCRNTRWIGIRDETGRLFPVHVDGACRSHIFNAAETCLVDAVPELVAAGVDAITIDARGKPADYAREMVRAYREAIAFAAQKPGAVTRDPATFRGRVRAIALGGITAGHYTRGLKEE